MSKKHLIQILPPQLANQIAAGEVVERPASVVKELVENSLDAGANQISIEIEKGGSQLIKIRDNGCGIGKDDLALALARHATSKIASLEDLEAILSLGFRGEALASISSVSRLTLTSRPEGQAEAWQAYAQGREMEVEIQPASHPVGTTIEVANLFFNTPARRKFLRTDKTEFAHIDEIVRRIALAKPNVSFTLSHNGKVVRQYRKVADNSVEQQQKRVAAICGEEFIAHATHLDWQHGDLHLHGWIGSPVLARPQNDLCYSYVNGRMMRDKTINHAIRQAFGDSVPKEHYPAFVLFLDLDPTMVDVNVHPAKHEVRFHQGRLVHDFIYQGVLNVLQAQPSLALSHEKNGVNEPLPTYLKDNNRPASGQNIFAQTPIFEGETSSAERSQAVRFLDFSARPYSSKNYPPKNSDSVSRSAQKWYGELVRPNAGEINGWESKPKMPNLQNEPQISPLAPPVITAKPTPEKTATVWQNPPTISPTSTHAQPLAIVKNQAVLMKEGEDFYLIPLAKLARLKLQTQLAKGERQALLIPLNLSLDESQAERWQSVKDELAAFGFVIQEKTWQGQLRLSVSQVPSLLREQNLQQLLLTVLAQPPQAQAVDLAAFFANQLDIPTAYSLSDAVNWLADIENSTAKTALAELKIAVDFGVFWANLSDLV